MFVGIVRIELHLPGCTSLKDKRSIVRGLKDRIRERLHAAAAEVEFQDLWQRAALGVAVGGRVVPGPLFPFCPSGVFSAGAHHVREMLLSVRRLVEGTHGADLIDWQEREA